MPETSLRNIQQRAESRAVIAAAFGESGRIRQARIWALKADQTWSEWVEAKERQQRARLRLVKTVGANG